MAEFDDKLNSLLSNPEAMDQIMKMAQSLMGGEEQTSGGTPPPNTPPLQQPDQAADIEALLGLGKGAADDQVLDVLGLDPGTLDQAAHHLGGDVVGARARQRAAIGGGEG